MDNNTNSSGLFSRLPNKFQGNISPDVTLVYIFQTLSTNQQHGWLSLRREDHENHEVTLFFKGDQVAVASGVDEKLNSIIDRLFYAQHITQDQYQQLQEGGEGMAEKPWKRLHEAVNGHPLQPLVLSMEQTFCYEAICNLFNWPTCYYEFVSIHEPEANHELVPFSPYYEVEGILVEIDQRQKEEIDLQNSFHSPTEIFVRGTEPKASPNEDDSIHHIWSIVNFQRIEQILAYSFLNDFDTKRILVALLQKGHIRFIQDDELKQKISTLKAKSKQDAPNSQSSQNSLIEALPYAELLFQRAPVNPENIQILAECYQATKKTQELQQLYYNLAQRFLDSQNQDEKLFGAFYLKRFCDVDVENSTDLQIDARAHLFQMVLQKELDAKAIDFNFLTEGKKLFQLLRTRKNDADARQILEYLLQTYPHDKYLHSQYINVCLDLQDIPTAVAEYETMAKIYERDKNLQELLATYQKIIRLTPNRKDIQKKMDTLHAQLHKRPTRFGSLKALILLIILGVSGWFLYQQYFIPIDNITPQNNSNHFPNDNSNLHQEITQLQQQIDKEVLAQLSTAQSEIGNKKWDTAEKILNDALARAPSEHIKSDINIELQKIKAVHQEQEQIIQEFEQSLAKAKEHEQKKAWREAQYEYIKIRSNSKFEHISQYNEIHIPIYCTVRPANTKITIDQEKPLFLEQSKGVLYCKPDFKHITFEHEGYTTYQFENSFENSDLSTQTNQLSSAGSLEIVLAKSVMWEASLKKSVSATPYYAKNENTLYVPSSNGLLLFKNIELKTPPQLAQEKIWGINQLPYNLCQSQGILYIPEKLQIHTWDMQNNTVAGSSLQLAKTEITSDPILAENYSVLIFPTKNGLLHFQPLFDPIKNQWAPTKTVQLTKLITLPLVVAENRVLAMSTDGKIFCYNIQKCEKIWELSIARVIRCAPLIINKSIYLPAGNTLWEINIDTGKFRQTAFQGEGLSTPVYKDNILYFITTKNIYAMSLNPQKMLWSKEVPKGVLASSKISPIISNNNILYFSTQATTKIQDDKKVRVAYFYALDLNQRGEILWSYTLPDEPAATPLMIGNLIIQPANKLYGFLDN